MPFSKARMRQWTEEMSVHACRDGAGRVVGLRSNDPAIEALDGVAGVCSIVPALERVYCNHLQYKYFGHLVNKLQGDGYASDIDVLATPYDFRMVLDPTERAQLFSRLKGRIEFATAAAGAPAVMVAHSLGGVLAAWFLSTYVSEAWALAHLHKLICLNAPFGGSPHASRALVYGDYYIPSYEPLFRDGLRLNSGVLMCLPNALGGAASALACAERGRDEPFAESLEAREALFDPAALAVGSAVPVDVVVSAGVQTMTRFRADTGETVQTSDGDGLVPANSLDAAFRVFTGPRVARVVVDNTSHVSIVGDPRMLRYIQRECLF
jgi:pimeloyl-ACP methyl ester carboxylesterase